VHTLRGKNGKAHFGIYKHCNKKLQFDDIINTITSIFAFISSHSNAKTRAIAELCHSQSGPDQD